ncbi:DUF4350 domain-containing protein [Haloprofundus sp. MHR1]|uniref:DUF4350 domain-containing protein n=1 Tax=Haloprofundus sp. MHR1 TaxID=2572921 RepID=UPI0010BF59A9|nr:DUF4350 domain-containing protein [Haloprofundus sp. MHR1]QCJ45999.1 DUF4350 domain-containing protein [Haloprofundus sp. MHR1]
MRLRGRDWSYPELLTIVLALCLAVSAIFAASTSAAAFGIYNGAWDGTTQLQTLADDTDTESAVILNTTAYDSASTNTTAFIISPERNYSAQQTARVQAFVESGGTLVVAEDYGAHSNPLLEDLGVSARIDGRPLRDEEAYYRSPAMPLATNISDTNLTRDVEQLSLNHGTVLSANNSTVLARSSEFSYLDTTPNGELDDNETLRERPVMVSERVGDGRVIVVSDPSVFINSMVDRPGNEQLSRNLLTQTDAVLFDFSNAGQQPPLAVALLTLRQSAFLQAIVGVGLIGLIGLWAYNPSVETSLSQRLQRDKTAHPQTESSTKDNLESRTVALESYLLAQHPEWERERVRRIIKGVLMNDAQKEDNE